MIYVWWNNLTKFCIDLCPLENSLGHSRHDNHQDGRDHKKIADFLDEDFLERIFSLRARIRDISGPFFCSIVVKGCFIMWSLFTRRDSCFLNSSHEKFHLWVQVLLVPTDFFQEEDFRYPKTPSDRSLTFFKQLLLFFRTSKFNRKISNWNKRNYGWFSLYSVCNWSSLKLLV